VSDWSDMSEVPPGVTTTRYSPRLRRRLTLAFAGAIVVTVLALSVGSYVALRAMLENDALEAALAQSRFNLYLADTILPDEPAPEDYDAVLEALAIRGDFQTLIQAQGDTYRSSAQITSSIVQAGLADAVTSDRLSYQRIRLGGSRTIAVGAALPSAGSFYFLFPQDDRQATLDRLRDVFLVLGLVLVVLGSLLGYWLARRTLLPVSDAAAAAGQMASGDLSVRLPTGPDEFGALADSFNTMAANLETKIEALEAAQSRERRFVADVAHELRTPLAALVSEASLLHSRLTDPGLLPDTQRAIQLVTQDVGRLRRLIEDLLEIGRIDAGAEDLRLEGFAVGRFLAQVGRARGWPATVELQVGTAAAPADRAAETPEGDILLVSDRRRLERIVVNLVENALRHGGPPVSVHAHVVKHPQTDQRQFALDVADHGPGIPPEHLPLVFERFYKTDPSRSSRSGAGSGLGLSIAWENARMLGGVLRVKSEEGKGTLFSLRLPLSR
jgi:signal transduction histidine kinase